MNRVYFAALSNPYMPAELVERVGFFNQRASAWGAERTALAEKLAAIVSAPETVHHRPVESWIGQHSFGDAAVVLRAVEEIRRRRLAIPVEGLRLLDELTAIRVAAGIEWEGHIARLRAALSEAEASARKQVAKLKLSDATKAAHVAEVTEPQRTAAKAECPCPAAWVHWSEHTVQSCAAILVEELQAVFARYT